MQIYDMNKNFTQDFNANVDTNAETAIGACRIPLFCKVKMANANFAHNVGLVDMRLGS